MTILGCVSISEMEIDEQVIDYQVKEFCRVKIPVVGAGASRRSRLLGLRPFFM
jgi:hypothetical protein